ncbi:hypothetical protein EH228_06845 [Erwinia endophytica]|uniref:helix-turn-helix transcriptional regulator n=1 Tax=Erwinia endophytica TaxID=1563158 RepID=UPI001265EF56|nr:LuxR C-terminal-related transcriptional regulator [Erwinia endophytica]KAB8312506.1 hypothetical protein EH228_06845 [Erwinia endophytica]
MGKVLIIEPCSYARIGLSSMLGNKEIKYDALNECFFSSCQPCERNIKKLFTYIKNEKFSLVIVGNINAIYGLQASTAFICRFHQEFGEKKKIALFSHAIRLQILMGIFGINVETIDISSSVNSIITQIFDIMNSPERGYISTASPSPLSKKQREVMCYFFQNITMVKMAKIQGENAKTLCVHKRRALRKLGITHPAQLLSISRERQLELISKGNA